MAVKDLGRHAVKSNGMLVGCGCVENSATCPKTASARLPDLPDHGFPSFI